MHKALHDTIRILSHGNECRRLKPFSVANPARRFSHAMQILNHYHYSFL